jgi:2-keto-4-pentenoate hydratase/2-oxohepta-3-ene-1,7-dioic acid hydratase in catechol pathway
VSVTSKDFEDLVSLGRRLANLRTADGFALGAEVEGRVLDVTATAATLGLPSPGDIDELLQNGGAALVRNVIESAGADPDAATLTTPDETPFAPLVTRPGKIVCIGFNYRKHAEETGTHVGDVPALFGKYGNALNHHEGTVPLPTKVSSWFDYETELVIVIGKEARDVTDDEALSYVAGYATGNDVSARDLQTQTAQLMAGKISDGFAPVGPWLVPAGLVPDPNNLRLQTWVNGETRQDWTTSDMIFDCKRLIGFVSGIMTLEPGDIMYTGTPQGVIFGEKKPMAERTWLKSGDVIVSELEGLGQLRVTLQ